MATMLVIDDEEAVLYSFTKIFDSDQTKVLTAQTGTEGLKQIRAHHPDVVILDLQLPDGSGLDVFREIQRLDPKKPVIFITAHGTTETAIEAMKRGAFDYLVKPVALEKLSQLLERAFEAARLMNVPAVLPETDREDRIVGRSAPMQEMCKAIGRIAPQDVNVLILGESGTGKELVARAIYYHSARADRPFLAINCAAIPESLLESELFGHEEGAFTGANRRRIGKFEQCNGGTLFLDEIGDMTASLQAKMLRILQEQQFERLGSNETVKTNVRVLAATNQHLNEMVNQGKFRKDLFYRLNGITIHIPPLRERLDDVAELAHYFLYMFNRLLHMDVRAIAPEALNLLQAYSWPGNVRELQGAIQEAMLTGSGNILLPDFLPEQLRLGKPSAPKPSAKNLGRETSDFLEALLQSGEADLYAKVIERVERILISRVLRHTHGHQAQASELLGLNRTTLRTKMRTLGLAMEKVLADDSAEAAHPEVT